jgi:hypothetical protein
MRILKIKDVLTDEIYREAFRNTYDLLANDITRQIFEFIKASKDNTHNEIEFDKLNPPCIVDIKIKYTNDEDVKLNYIDFGITSRYHYPEVNDGIGEIQINIFLSSNFSQKNFTKIYYVVYEVVRHEMEHYYKSKNKQYPNDDYSTMFDESDPLIFSEQVKNYILNPIEIDSYARSIVYVAKKQKKSFFSVLENVILRIFFKNDENIKEEWCKNPSILKNVDDTRDVLTKRIEEIYPRITEVWR